MKTSNSHLKKSEMTSSRQSSTTSSARLRLRRSTASSTENFAKRWSSWSLNWRTLSRRSRPWKTLSSEEPCLKCARHALRNSSMSPSLKKVMSAKSLKFFSEWSYMETLISLVSSSEEKSCLRPSWFRSSTHCSESVTSTIPSVTLALRVPLTWWIR